MVQFELASRFLQRQFGEMTELHSLSLAGLIEGMEACLQ